VSLAAVTDRQLERPHPVAATPSWSVRMPPARMLALPLAFTAGLAAVALLPQARANASVQWALLGTALALALWNAVLIAAARRRTAVLSLDVVLRKQHYLQALAQSTILVYWGWHWPQVYESAYLLAAQLLFAYVFDMLLCWSRRDGYVFGFGPFPIVFSINLFLWFKPDWFFWQFALVAVGLTAKELIRWERDGRRVHIFNPSSFPLAVCSVVLLMTGATDITWGNEIAVTQFFPPHIYVLLFVVGLPGQFFFGVTTMTMSAVVATYLFGLLYFAATGIYFFYDSYIPISVFLGMHLLFTDPSTAPRTELGRIVFGVLYGLSTVVLYQALGSAGLPTFYDKLLQVPLLNLSVRWIDRAVRSRLLAPFDPAAIGRALAPRMRHVAYMSIWTVVFGVMLAADGVGDSHRGQWLPFWQQACEAGRPYACPYVADLQVTYCAQGSAWSCNEAGIHHLLLAQSGEDGRRLDAAGAVPHFTRGCDLGSAVACENVRRMAAGAARLASAAPTVEDYAIVLRGSKGPIADRTPAALYARACEQGWPDTCDRAGQMAGR
jgi:hypothetical protein